jgi:DNA-binding response OmpR family regulator
VSVACPSCCHSVIEANKQRSRMRPVTACLQAEHRTGRTVARAMSTGLGESPTRWRPLRSANLEICPAERRVLAGGRPLAVTAREFETLLALAERRNRVVPRTELYALIWGGRMTYRDRSVDVFVRRVRKKLHDAAPGWAYIHTHFGVGYRFAPERLPHPDEHGRAGPPAR